jgi:outer membrane protein assembly factor BamB
VTPPTAELTALGASVQLSAQVLDQNGQAMAGAAVTWSSGSATIATVSGTGLVTAVQNGSVTITGTSGSVSGNAAVTVAQVAATVTVTPAADTLAPGDTLRLSAEATDANGNAVTEAEFAWTSSAATVATVDNSGLVTAVAAGSATITAATGDASAASEIAVKVRLGDFDLADANAAPGGITYASGRFYVADYLDDKVYAYDASSGARAADHDFDLIVTGIVVAITYANDRFYVLSWLHGKVYAYTASGARAAAYDFDLDDDNSRTFPGGMTYASGRFYVTDWGDGDGKVYAYDASGARAAAYDFDLVTSPSGGMKYARDRFYVVDRFDKKVYAYTASGARAAAYDFDLDDDNYDASGITYANDRFYVVNGSQFPDDKVYAYDAAAANASKADVRIIARASASVSRLPHAAVSDGSPR